MTPQRNQVRCSRSRTTSIFPARLLSSRIPNEYEATGTLSNFDILGRTRVTLMEPSAGRELNAREPCLELLELIHSLYPTSIQECASQRCCRGAPQVSTWTLDSGASCHMTNDHRVPYDLRPAAGQFRTAGPHNLKSTGVGKAILRLSAARREEATECPRDMSPSAPGNSSPARPEEC